MEHGITERTMRLLQNHVRIATEMAQGTQEDSALNMQQMLLQKTSHAQASEKTFSESTMEFLENLGGIEGIARKQALLDRAQGEENLQLILELTEEIGAPDEIRAKYADYIYCKDMEETCGGWDEICETKKLVDELGGRETLAELLRLAERFGGVEPLMKLADQQYRLWDGIFEGKRKEEHRPDRA